MKWSQIKHFGGIKLFRLTHIATLACAPLLALNSAFLRATPDAPSLLSVACLYFASASLSIALMIYDLLCPADIKRATSQSQFYLDRYKELKAFGEYVEAHKSNANEYLNDLVKTSANHAKVDSPENSNVSLEWYARQFVSAFGSSWEMLNKSRPIARALSAWMFWIAVVLALVGILLVPALQLASRLHLENPDLAWLLQ
jgi:hypothetical protein